jgi:hypothetical protein
LTFRRFFRCVSAVRAGCTQGNIYMYPGCVAFRQSAPSPFKRPTCIQYVSAMYPWRIHPISRVYLYSLGIIKIVLRCTQRIPNACPRCAPWCLVSRVVFGWCVQFVSIMYPGCLHARRSPTCADRVSTVYPICTHGVSSVCLVVSVRDVPMFPRRRLRCVLMLYPWCIHDVSRVYPERTHPLVCPPNVVSRAYT